jgi:hypothetical protein
MPRFGVTSTVGVSTGPCYSLPAFEFVPSSTISHLLLYTHCIPQDDKLIMGFSDFLTNFDNAMKVTGAALDEFGKTHVGPALAHTAAELDRFGKEQLAPALARTGEELHRFGNEQLAPVLAKTGQELDRFGKEQLGPVLAKTGEEVHRFGEETVKPVVKQSLENIDQFKRDRLIPAAFGFAHCAAQFGEHQLKPALEKTVESGHKKLVPVAAHIGETTRKNPLTTAVAATGLLVTVCPWIVTVPFLSLLGFTAGGPAAGMLPSALS